MLVEAGLGLAAGFPDAQYVDAGAEVVRDRTELFRRAEVILQVRAGGANLEQGATDLPLLHRGHVLIAGLDPLSVPQSIPGLASTGATVFALELIPRITRAQSMDVLSSMATIAGYKAVLLAASAVPRMFPMMMTAAGTITPAKVLVLGAGVAGLQAISTARRLGAVVQAYDVRPAAKEQVESLGAKFVQLNLDAEAAEQSGGYARAMDEAFYIRQREQLGAVIAQCDVVITTAAVPGKKAPLLVTSEAVRRMSPGSVIVDLASERGGNCQLTRPGETYVDHGVTIIGPLNVPATVPLHASEMFSRNVQSFLKNMVAKDGRLTVNMSDEIVRGTLVTRDGEVAHPVLREILGLPKREAAAVPPV